jgi:hypothetical protein
MKKVTSLKFGDTFRKKGKRKLYTCFKTFDLSNSVKEDDPFNFLVVLVNCSQLLFNKEEDVIIIDISNL